jgi:hypothetical protein
MGIIQVNAIRSWLALCPPCEILLLGNDEGTPEIACEHGIRHIPGIECNEFGTPLISSLFETAEMGARYNVLCQVNADIMLSDDLVLAVQRLTRKKKVFLATGRRWDVEVTSAWDFSRPDWPTRLRSFALEHGSLHPATGMDYFLFAKGSLGKLPPFAIGRRVLDNWLIFRARSLRLPVIDLTNAVMAVHQNHDYEFHPYGQAGVMTGPEVDRNLGLAGGLDHVFTLDDATHVLTATGVKRVLTTEKLRRHLNTLGIVYPSLAPVLKAGAKFLNLARKGPRL